MSKKKITKKPHQKKTSRRYSLHKKFIKKISSFSIRTNILIFLGLLFIIIPTFFYINETIQLAFFTPHVSEVKKESAIPTAISIPSVKINLPIFETAFSNGTWEIANNGISHLAISARPTEKGPIILYGHNTNSRFGPIRWLSKGEKITITTADGNSYDYIIEKTEDTSPNKITELTNTKNEMLVLYTCDGFADLQRFLVFAKPVTH